MIDLLVAPLVGAWIEILCTIAHQTGYMVAPLVGAWIEMTEPSLLLPLQQRRSSRGSVD